MNERQHPLLFYPVIKQLLSYLDFQQFQTCREVCSAWKSVADMHLRDRAKVKIVTCKNLTKFINDIQSDNYELPISHFELKFVNLENSHKLFHTIGSRIVNLKLSFCEWRSATLRKIIFKTLPNLRSLEISSEKNTRTLLSEPLWPMSFIPYGSFSPLVNLKDLSIIGDFSNRTDLFYDLIKSSPNLEIIRFSKYQMDHDDDLFGTWLTEIILSCNFPLLKCLELECILIQLQIESMVNQKYPLKRLCFDLDVNSIDNNSIQRILTHFPFLESVELGIDNASQCVLKSIIDKYKNHTCWIALHPISQSRITFPNHAYVLV